jgi:hypothetical protein
MIKINSIGPPPERHADRVVAEMMRDLARRHADVHPAIADAFKSSRDGTPKSQRKMADRIKRAGAFHVILETGKRGKYSLAIIELVGWDPARDSEIMLCDPIPEKPWIAWLCTFLKSKGNWSNDEKIVPLLFVTHHAMSRTAQRLHMRDETQLEMVSSIIWNAAASFIGDNLKSDMKEWVASLPSKGVRVPLANGSNIFVVLKKHEKWDSLIATTVITKE